MFFILKQKRIAFKVFFSPLKFSYQKSYQSFIHKNAQASQVKVLPPFSQQIQLYSFFS